MTIIIYVGRPCAVTNIPSATKSLRAPQPGGADIGQREVNG
ncbi:hypothetical protein [Variovorax fucosicus]|nr:MULTISPECIES: hypothetical protein [unclassified Variovorax]